MSAPTADELADRVAELEELSKQLVKVDTFMATLRELERDIAALAVRLLTLERGRPTMPLAGDEGQAENVTV